jgi:hypothetical protein
LNLRFKDWRFIHKAYLNCLPTNAVVRPMVQHLPRLSPLYRR